MYIYIQQCSGWQDLKNTKNFTQLLSGTSCLDWSTSTNQIYLPKMANFPIRFKRKSNKENNVAGYKIARQRTL